MLQYHPWRDILAEHEEESSNGNGNQEIGGSEMAEISNPNLDQDQEVNINILRNQKLIMKP